MIELKKNWSINYNSCLICGNSDKPHVAHGMCVYCYKNWYNNSTKYPKQLFVCEYCGKEFYNSYMLKKGYELRFCSKSCATKSRRKFGNKTQLENAICREIKLSNRYLTIGDILSKLRISSKTLSKYRISILALNKKCSMKKPKSMFEYKVGCILKDIFSDLIFEHSFEDLKSDKGYLLYFDFYSPANNLLIEADGLQHRGQRYYNKNIGNLIRNDELKNKWCKDNNIYLIRIKYTRIVDRQYVIQSLKPFFDNKMDEIISSEALKKERSTISAWHVDSSESKRGRP